LCFRIWSGVDDNVLAALMRASLLPELQQMLGLTFVCDNPPPGRDRAGGGWHLKALVCQGLFFDQRA
jgi:hypothetical protein